MRWPTLDSKKERAFTTWGFAPVSAPDQVRKLDSKPGDQSTEEIVGVIYIESSVKNYTYSTDQLRLLTSIGLQAGLAIQNARLYHAGLQAERLAAIGETTTALSHSIKNILQALRGGADVVEMGLKANNLEQSRKGWSVVQRNFEKIYNLTLICSPTRKSRQPSVQLVNPEAADRRMSRTDRPLWPRSWSHGDFRC